MEIDKQGLKIVVVCLSIAGIIFIYGEWNIKSYNHTLAFALNTVSKDFTIGDRVFFIGNDTFYENYLTFKTACKSLDLQKIDYWDMGDLWLIGYQKGMSRAYVYKIEIIRKTLFPIPKHEWVNQ